MDKFLNLFSESGFLFFVISTAMACGKHVFLDQDRKSEVRSWSFVVLTVNDVDWHIDKVLSL